MLDVSSLKLDFAKPVLLDLDLQVPEGKIVGIVGPSGGGKSSLLKIIAGLLDADGGSVTWKGQKVKGPSEQLIPGHKEIQLVNQDFGLDLYHTAEQNIREKILYLPREMRDAFVAELLDLVELTTLKDSQAIKLSGGEQQRLSIARALAVEPELLLLDEPFAHLDAHLKERIGDYLRALSETRGTTCILVSHEGQDVLQWCSEIHFMPEGRIARSATPEDFYFRPESRYEALFFGEINEFRIEDGSTVLFRPTECKVVDRNGIPVTLISSIFAGAWWRTLLKTSKGERIVMYNTEQLKDVKEIAITRHHTHS